MLKFTIDGSSGMNRDFTDDYRAAYGDANNTTVSTTFFTTHDPGELTYQSNESGSLEGKELTITGIGGSKGSADVDVITFDLSTFTDSFSIAVKNDDRVPSDDDCFIFDGANDLQDLGNNNWIVSYTNNGVGYQIKLFAGDAQVKIGTQGPPPPSTEDGIVDGEDSDENMGLGYDDSNAPTNGGGDKITNDADLIYGNGGNDTIDGAGGNDTIFGDNPHDVGQSTREIFQWGDAPGFGNNANAGDFTQDTGSAKISFEIVSASAGVENQYETTTQNTENLDPAVSENQSFENTIRDDGGKATFRWSSDIPIQNVEFRVNDADGDAVITLRAYDENDNPIEVVLSNLGSGLAASDTDSVPGNDKVVSKDNNYTPDSAAEHSFLVTIPGPVKSWEIIHEQDGDNDTGINVTDIAFDVPVAPTDIGDDIIDGGDGDDILDGGFGNDTISGNADDDTIIASSGTDQVDGGEGRDTYDAQEEGAGDFPAGINGPDGSGGGGSFPAPNPATHEVFTFEIADDDDDLKVKNFSASKKGDGAQDFTITDNNDDDDFSKLTIKGNGGHTGDGDNDIFRFDLSGFDDNFTVELKSEDTSDQVVFTNVSSRTDNSDGSVTIGYTGSDGQHHTVTVKPGDATVITNLGSGGGGGTGSSGGSTLGAETIEVSVNNDGDGTVEKVNDGSVDTVTSVENFVAGEADAEADVITLTDAIDAADIGTEIQNIDQTAAVGEFTPAVGGGTVAFGPGGPTLQSILEGTDPRGTYTITDGDESGQIGNISFENFETINFEIVGANLPDGVVDGEEFGEVMGPGYDDSNGPTDGGGDQIDGTDGDDDSIEGNGGDDTIDAGQGNDTVDGGVGEDQIEGNVGNDILEGGEDNDTLDGGDGDDIIRGGDDQDSIIGSAGKDSVDGGSGGVDNDTLDLRELGTASVVFSSQDEEDGIAYFSDTGDLVRFEEIENLRTDGTTPTGRDGIVEGTLGDDVIDVSYSDDPDGDFVDNDDALPSGGDQDIIIAKDGDDTVLAGLANDVVDAGQGNDIVYGNEGDDCVFGADGDDFIEGNSGDDTLLGEDGNDTLDAGGGNDSLVGGIGDDRLTGNPGDDTLDGGDGNDTLLANEGDDVLRGGAGDDTISTGGGSDTVDAGDDADRIIVGAQGDQGNPNNQFVDGGSGGDDNDTLEVNSNYRVEYVPGTNNEDGTVFLQDSNGVDTGDKITFVDIENIIKEISDNNGVVEGTDGADSIGAGYEDADGDVIDNFDSKAVFNYSDATDTTPYTFTPDVNANFAGDQRDAVQAGAGNDTVEAGDGDDIVHGGEGDDSILGQEGFDELIGDAGNDTIDTGLGDDRAFGGDGDDSIIGGLGDDTLFGGDGGDTIEGGLGNNSIEAGEGNDVITGGSDSEVLSGGLGDDSITSLGGNDTVDGGQGNDTIALGADDDIADGGAGNDSISGGDGDDTIFGGAGVDTLIGGAGSDLLDGGTPGVISDDAVGSTDDVLTDDLGDDTLNGSSGNDTIDGGADNDVLLGGTGNDSIVGGSGNDTIQGDAELQNSADPSSLIVLPTNTALAFEPSNDNINAGDGDDLVLGETGNDTISGGAGQDTVRGGLDNDSISGDDNDDSLSGGEGDDTITGDAGDDTLDGGADNDSILGGVGNDSIIGGAGNDTINGGDGNDSVDGGDGDDEITTGDGNDVVVDLLGDNIIDTSSTIVGGAPDDNDSVQSGAGNDSITTGDDNDTISAGDGNDTIDAGPGDDLVQADDGDDFVVGGRGLDTLSGGEGNDTIYGDLVNEGGGLPNSSDPVPDDSNDDIRGEDGDDVIFGQDDNDTLSGGVGNDTIDGGADDDDIFGGADDDSLSGDQGDDSLSGDEGNDSLSGGQGSDIVIGGSGDDQMSGGNGDDLFQESSGDGADTITDFNAGNTGSITDGDKENNDFVDLSGFYNDTTRADVNNNGGNFGTNLGMLRADAADGTLDGVINGTDYSGQIAGIDLTLQNGGVEVTGSDLTEDNTNVACFVRGTQIATRRGSVPIEELKAGDEVITMDHGFQKIRWIGSTSVAAEGSLAPVVIRKGAMGNERDLRVSPQHRMLVRGWHVELMFGQKEALVPAKALINDETVFPLEGGTVDYFHMMFDRHELVYAEGIPSESFHPGHVGIGSFAEDTRQEILSLFPQLREDAEGYSEHVRPSLKVREAKVLAENPELMK